MAVGWPHESSPLSCLFGSCSAFSDSVALPICYEGAPLESSRGYSLQSADISPKTPQSVLEVRTSTWDTPARWYPSSPTVASSSPSPAPSGMVRTNSLWQTNDSEDWLAAHSFLVGSPLRWSPSPSLQYVTSYRCRAHTFSVIQYKWALRCCCLATALCSMVHSTTLWDYCCVPLLSVGRYSKITSRRGGDRQYAPMLLFPKMQSEQSPTRIRCHQLWAVVRPSEEWQVRDTSLRMTCCLRWAIWTPRGLMFHCGRPGGYDLHDPSRKTSQLDR